MKHLSVQPPGRADGPAVSRKALPTVLKVLALLAAVMLLSVLLIPRGTELAWLRAKSGQTAEALQLLEAAYAAGDRSVELVSSLARQRAQGGDPAGGIDLLEEALRRQPENALLLESLDPLYEQAGRRIESIATLERLQRLTPNLKRTRRLADLYAAQGQTRRQRDLLAQLVAGFDNAEVADWLLLARTQARLGEHAAAITTLDRMAAKFPKANDATVVAAQMSAALAGGDATAALARGRSRLKANAQAAAAEAPLMAGALMAGGRADLAAALLDPLLTTPPADQRVLATWAQAMSDAGRAGAALDRLDREDARANSSVQPLRLSLALAAARPDSALGALRSVGVQGASAVALLGAAHLAISTRHKDGLRWLNETAEDGLGKHDPLLAAQVAEALGDRTSALRWIRVADSGDARLPASTLQLARLLSRASQPQRAAEVLRRTGVPVNDPALLAEYARLHIALGIAPVGLAAIEKAIPVRVETGAPPAWAMLAAASSRHDAALRWLQGADAAAADESVLRDLYHLGMQGKAHALAIAASERLTARGRATDRDALMLVNALSAAGRMAEASTKLATLRQRVSGTDGLYAEILLAAWRQGEPVSAELRHLYLARLARHSESAEREADVTVLLELGAYAEAVATLERLAVVEPRRWLSPYLEAATRSGQRQRTVGMLNRLATNIASQPEELRPQIAFRLLEAGDKVGAERVFRTLAASSAPRDEATRRLLYVWGPRPSPSQREWLEARADKAQGRERADWMRLLTERGGANNAMKVYRRTNWPSADGDELLDAFLEASAASGDLGVLASTLRDMASRTRSAPMLARLARHAATVNDPRLERSLLEAAIAAGHADPALRRSLGLLAYRKNDSRTAEPHLVAYVEHTGGDGATHRALGEIRLLRGDAAAARASFERAVAAFEARPDRSYAGRVALAGLLQRVRKYDAARHLYEELLAERPQDDHLRADYASMLLDMGQTRSASALLKP